MADPITPDKSVPSPAPTPEPAAAAAPASEIVLVAAPTTEAAGTSPASTAAAPQAAASKGGRARSSYLLVALVGVAVTGAGSLMLLASAMRTPAPDARTPDAAAAAPAAPLPEPAAAVADTPRPVAPRAESRVESPDTGPTPKWAASRNPRKAGYGASMVFELAADSDVEVWRKRIRPVLTVRCAARATEVFVVTESPAMIEDNSNRHTIRMSFDGREPVEQKWEHSIDHDALFAPDGRAMIRRIAGARQLSFSFAPFNAPPATVTFHVEGFAAQHNAAVRTCGLETPTRGAQAVRAR